MTRPAKIAPVWSSTPVNFRTSPSTSNVDDMSFVRDDAGQSDPQQPIGGLESTFSVQEVARLVGVSARWLADECRAERVAHVHIARKRRFTAEQVAALVAKHTVVPPDEQRLDQTRARVLRQLARRSP